MEIFTFNLSNFNRKESDNSRGSISLVVVLTVLLIISTIALSASYVTSTELKLSSGTGESTVAFYAAESGIEEAMYKVATYPTNGEPAVTCNDPPPTPPTAVQTGWTPVNGSGAQYYISVRGCVGTGEIYSIQAIGEYRSTRRSIEISFY